MPKCIILSGIPTSGKSTFANKSGLSVISCDKIREDEFGKNYVFSRRNEDFVWKTFYHRISLFEQDFIVDNTNCKQIYIDRIKENLSKNTSWTVIIKRFDIPLWKAYYRNIKRWIFTGKYIPVDVLRAMYKNYNHLWKK